MQAYINLMSELPRAPVVPEGKLSVGQNEIDGDRFTVLVVDDHPDLAEVAADLLQIHGLKTVVAYSGEEALAILLRGERVDAMFTDVMMPGIDGFELAEIAARLNPKLRIVLTSGHIFERVAAKKYNYPFLKKPYQIEVVISYILDASP